MRGWGIVQSYSSCLPGPGFNPQCRKEPGLREWEERHRLQLKLQLLHKYGCIMSQTPPECVICIVFWHLQITQEEVSGMWALERPINETIDTNL